MRMTNNSLQNELHIDLTSSTKKRTRTPSPPKPRKKKQIRKSNLSAPVLRPATITEDPEEPDEPPKRALDFERPRQAAGHLCSGAPWLRPPPPRPQCAPARQQYAPRLPAFEGAALLPSPTFSDPAENMQPGLYTDQETGHTFPIDQDMIDAAQILLTFSRSGTDCMTHHSPVRSSNPNTRDEQEQQSPYESWKPGDARRHIVDSGLSPKARRIRDIRAGLDVLPLTAVEKRNMMKKIAASVKKPVKHTDEAYFSNPTLNAINNSPPKRRRANASADDYHVSEEDVTEVEDDDDSDMEDSDYQASSPRKDDSSPVQETIWMRNRSRARLIPPPPRRMLRSIEDDSDGEKEGVFLYEDEDENMAEISKWESPSPESPDLPPIRHELYRQPLRWNKLSAPPRILISRSASPSNDSETDDEKEKTPPRPLSSPITRTPSRALSRGIGRGRTTSTEYHTPESESVQRESSPSSLEKWQRAARKSQAHRRTASLESFLERSKAQFEQMKNEVDSESDDEMQLDEERTPRAVGGTTTPRQRSVRKPEPVTPASSGLEEGEIVEDAASDATTVVSPTRQRQMRRNHRNPYELNY